MAGVVRADEAGRGSGLLAPVTEITDDKILTRAAEQAQTTLLAGAYVETQPGGNKAWNVLFNWHPATTLGEARAALDILARGIVTEFQRLKNMGRVGHIITEEKH